ncbi:hypothetical protein DFH27DRAFT_460310, partial [Peziza echinospora]
RPHRLGGGDQDVLDPTYRKALHLDPEDFAINFSPERAGILREVQQILGDDDAGAGGEQREVYAELYKLNVYAPGGFFKAHKDTPRAENMFGSLVVCLPCEHAGGELILRQDGGGGGGGGREHVCDWGASSAVDGGDGEQKIKCPWAAFYSEIEHEIHPVTSGHRLTLTYNLYFRPPSTSGEVARPLPTPLDPSLHPFHTTPHLLLDTDPTFLPTGGVLVATLSNSYPVP